MPESSQEYTKQFERASRIKQIAPIAVAIILITIAVVTYVLLKKPTEVTEAPTPTGGAITYWTTSIPSETLAEIVADFQEENPDITVSYDRKPKDRYSEVLKTRLQTGTNLPDVFEVENVDVTALKNYLSTSSTFTANQLEADYFPAARSVCARSSAVKCIPLEFDGLVLAYNSDWLAQVGVKTIPDNWSNFKQTANSLTVKSTSSDNDVVVFSSGVAMGTGTGVTRSSEVAWLLMLQNGVELDQESGWRKMAEDKGVAAAEVYASYYSDNIWAGASVDDLESFINEKTAMVFVTNDDLDYIVSQNPGFIIKTTMPPQVSGQKNLALFGATAVASASPCQEAAWKFAEYLSSGPVQRKLSTISARRDLLHKTSSDVQLKGFAEIYLSSETVVFPDYSEAKTAMTEALDDIADDAGVESQLESVISELR